MYIFGSLLMANGNIWPLNRIFMTGVALNLVTNFVFVSVAKAHGAAASALVTQTFIVTALVWTSIRVLQLHIDWGMVVRVAFFVVGLFVASILLYQCSLPWLVSFLCACVFALVLALILKLIDKDIVFLKN
jgi:O-antigen/teichoic acid export membrane protein